MEEKYLIYNNTDINDTTIGKFFNRNEQLIEGVSIQEFLKYDGGTGKSNIERLKETYTKKQLFFYEHVLLTVESSSLSHLKTLSESSLGSLPFNLNTKILIPKDNFKTELTFIKGKNLEVQQRDSAFYFAEKLLQLLNDPGYARTENLIREGRDYTVEFINENCQVFLWSRSLGKIIDVSQFVQDLSTSKSEIGNFNLSLSPLHNLNDLNFINEQDILNYFVLNNDGKNNLDFFYKNIQYNDIVFIRFEKLKLEEEQSINREFFVDQSKLPGKIWDMIGLVDTVSQSTTYNNNDYSIRVSGRDFYKLLIEDGSYFLSLQYLNNGETQFAFNQNDKWFKRNFGDPNGNTGTFEYYEFTNTFRRIDDTVGFIINQLSNIEILPDNQNIFSNYGDRRTKRYRLSEEKNTIETDEVSGVWQIIKLMFDRTLEDRRVMDASISYVDSTILDQFNKLCQKPFVEFFGDTFGDEFNFIVRKPPFTKELIDSFLNPLKKTTFKHKLEGNYQIIELDEKDIEGYGSMEWDDTFYSWYQIQPKDNLLGQYSELMSGGMIGIIYFDKLCQYYGNKRLVVPDNYLSINTISAIESEKDLNNYRLVLLNDLKYLIDSNSYLPFTRRGTITLPKGDRRIKRGTFIRINPTREIFYVDAVSHSLSFQSKKVDRSTTLQLSRGMLERYIKGDVGFEEDGKIIEKRFSYFDIIKTEIVSDKREYEISESGNEYQSEDGIEYSVKIPLTSGVAYRNNNPGNLQFTDQPDAIQGEIRKGYENRYWAKFETPEIGFKNVIRQLEINRDRDKLNIEQLVNKYSPKNENKTENLINFYVTRLNKPPLNNINRKTKLSDVDLYEFAKLIVLKESSTTVDKKAGVKKEDTGVKKNKVIKKVAFDHKFVHRLDEEQLDFFMKRKQFNFLKYE